MTCLKAFFILSCSFSKSKLGHCGSTSTLLNFRLKTTRYRWSYHSNFISISAQCRDYPGLLELGMCGNAKVGSETFLKSNRLQKVKTASQFSVAFFKTEKNMQFIFLNVVCLLTKVLIN